MRIKFYKVPLPRCGRCGKPATFTVMGTGNVEYTKCCDDCVEPKIGALQEYWDNQSNETQSAQLQSTMQHPKP